MNTRTYKMSKLAILLLAASPLVAGAAATDPGTDYSNDTPRSYVHDQTSEALNSLNGILCYISSMAPAQMVGLGDYIALVDKNVCEPNSGGGQASTTNTGTDYTSMIVNSSRTDNASPMIGKVWSNEVGGGGNKSSLFARLSATQAPNPPSDPFGRFRMDFCGQDINGVCTDSGYIISTDNGLSFFSEYTGDWGPCGVVTQTRKLQLNASSTAGSGRLNEARSGVGATCADLAQPPVDFLFAYNANFFRRSDGTNDTCFSRNPADAEESVWRYGLYDNTSGARIERNSGFPIEYTDIDSNTMNGFVGYWGLNTPTPVHPTNKVVNKVTYGNGTATKTPYTLKQTGGKLIKYTTVVKTLAQLDKVKFQFWAQQTSTPVTSNTGYEVYWDETGQTFMVSGVQDPNTYNIIPQTPVALSIAAMQAASPWGLYGWSNMLGGQFSISQSAMSTLSSATNVTTHVQDVVYPSNFTSGMICISNCPTKADIDASNADVSNLILPYTTASSGWAAYDFNQGVALTAYTFNTTTGNLVDPAAADVVSTATSGRNQWGVNSGRMLDDTAQIRTWLDEAVSGRGGATTGGPYIQSDIDAVINNHPGTPYYEWQTGANNWNQLAYLIDGSNAPVMFEPPLNVTWDVPGATQADIDRYGISAGATITLQYGGFGDLWGIPSTCIDVSTNLPCVLNGATPTDPSLQRWTPEFSIPSGQTIYNGSTPYLVKALEKEVRLGKVVITDCDTAGLTLPTAGTITLPSASAWLDPSHSNSSVYIGPMPTFSTPPAPRVIQGEVMY